VFNNKNHGDLVSNAICDIYA